MTSFVLLFFLVCLLLCYLKNLDMKKSLPANMSFYEFTTKIRDPFVMAVLLEDMAATTGVLIAVGGIGLTAYTGTFIKKNVC